MEFDKKTKEELKELCKKQGLKGYSTKNKSELVELLRATDPPLSNTIELRATPSPAVACLCKFADLYARSATLIEAELLENLSTLHTELSTLLAAKPSTEPPSEPQAEFRPVSHELHIELSKELRQEQGIFFTPKKQRDRLFEVLGKIRTPKNVLEPSFGSGEFVLDARSHWPSAQITGVEFNKTIFTKFKSIAPSTITLHQKDFLLYKEPTPKYDAIIGNPPYFVTTEKDPRCMTGRGNIFVQFIYKCLTEHLVPGGLLAFILPTSFYNCTYYEPCRKYMETNTTILHVENMDGGFYETAQDTMLLVVQNTPPPPSSPPPYFVIHGGASNISPKAADLCRLLRGASTLADLGLSVKTGEVVWNQHKEKLHERTGTLVIYSSNVVKNKLVLDNLKGGKKQYIQGFHRPPCMGPALCVNRGYGNKFTLSYVRVPEGTTFYGENHMNVVTGPVAALNRLERSLEDPRTSQFIRDFVGNGALSKTELETVLPIF